MTEALLVLEDGSSFPGRAFGAPGETFGEIVFNTAMSGYQEVVTDPSYAGQIVIMTSPHQGNYGVNAADPESRRIHAAGLVVRESARLASSWRAERSLAEELADAGVTGIEEVDTRELTLRIREGGAMRAAVSTEDLDPRSLVERVRERPGMLGADLARTVSTDEPYGAEAVVGPATPRADERIFRVAAYDWGIKRNILRLLAANGCEATVFPAETPADHVLRGGFDGVFLSNGPGDPAATTYAIEIAGRLLGRVPVFGICLGHQIVALAARGSTYKLKFGHRGANQPVLNADTGRIEVTSHNHGFAVSPRGWAPVVGSGGLPGWPGSGPSLARATPLSLARGPRPAHRTGGDSPPTVVTYFGPAALTHWNLNDGTLEGLRFLGIPAFTVQYHPEAAPGPHDSRYLFDRFVSLMDGGEAGVRKGTA